MSQLSNSGIFTKGNENIVKLLINNGANIDIVHENGDTALMWASYYGQKKSVKHLINNGANVNATDVNGKSVLMWAVSKANNKKIVKLLIDYGADIYATDVNGKPVWAVWAENNNLNSL